MQHSEHTPLVRNALLAAFDAPAHTLRRAANGFAAPPRPDRTSGTKQHQSFSKRLLLKMSDGGLIRLNDPFVPTCATLTDAGINAAQAFKATQKPKAVRA